MTPSFVSQTSPTPSASVSVCSRFQSFGQLSHASPTPSASESFCEAFGTLGQLSTRSPTPSPSASEGPDCGEWGSGSQASPIPSWSESRCPTFGTRGQLSTAFGMPSPSISGSRTSGIPSPSRSDGVLVPVLASVHGTSTPSAMHMYGAAAYSTESDRAVEQRGPDLSSTQARML